MQLKLVLMNTRIAQADHSFEVLDLLMDNV